MRINQIANNSFKSLMISPLNEYSKVQSDVTDDILYKLQMPVENYNGRSTMEMLEEDYKMDLVAHTHGDRQSIILYFAQSAHLKGELDELKTLTPIGIYNNNDNKFEIVDIENRLIDIENGTHRNFFSKLATLVMGLGIVLIPIISLVNLSKTKKMPKIENVNQAKEIVVDSLKNVSKDTIDFLKALKK